jgi:hypothetical protein
MFGAVLSHLSDAARCEDSPVDDDLQRRIASNESMFRDVNEAVRSGRWPGEDGAPVAYRCECARLGCSRLIELNARDYERVRAYPRRFLVAPGHELADVETVVESHAGYVVVQKGDEAGKVAEATDPRP